MGGRGGRIKLKLTGTITDPKICVHSKFQLKQMKKCKVMAVKPKLKPRLAKERKKMFFKKEFVFGFIGYETPAHQIWAI